MEKLCVFCKHMSWSIIEYTYYSTLTGGDISGGMICRKGHFDYIDSGHIEDENDFRQFILRAEDCKDFKLV